MKLRARPALKRAAKSAFTFVPRAAPLHRRTLIERAGIAVNVGSQGSFAGANEYGVRIPTPQLDRRGWVRARKGTRSEITRTQKTLLIIVYSCH